MFTISKSQWKPLAYGPALDWKPYQRPRNVAGEAYMNGTLNVKDATTYDLINLVVRKMRDDSVRPAAKLCIQLIFRATLNSFIQFDAHTRMWRIIGSVGSPGSTAL